MGQTESRKVEHIRICLDEDVEFRKTNGFEKVELEHSALPESEIDKVDTSTEFLGKKFRVPIFIEAMTGGMPEAENINRNLAMAAQALGIGMGVGSQRAALENHNLAGTYAVRDVAPDIMLVGNLGAAQVIEYPIEKIQKAVDMIKADALAVHLNITQESLQPEGDMEWNGLLDKLEEVASALSVPVIVKETGCGISGKVAGRLEKTGIAAIDIAGAGGTSWSKVEEHRGGAKGFAEWGIPTAKALADCAKSTKLPLIASGGIRSGLEIAKAIAMGASLGGLALPLLGPSTESWEAVKEHLEKLISEFRTSMFLAGARNIKELKKVKYDCYL